MHKSVVKDQKFMHKNVDMERKAYQELLEWKNNRIINHSLSTEHVK